MNLTRVSRKNAPVEAKSKTGINAARSLQIGEVDDVFEQEADRVAKDIVDGGRLMRRGWSLSRMTVRDSLQRSSTLGPPSNGAPPIVHAVLQTPGRPLDVRTRESMEQTFGSEQSAALPATGIDTNSIFHRDTSFENKPTASYSPVRQASRADKYSFDLRRVRIHTGPTADDSARAVNAKAYTVGNQVVFAAGHYSPDSINGRYLLAHELAHVVQQSSGYTRLSRAPLDLSKVETELFWGDELTQDQGEIGFGATPKAPDGDSSLPIEALVFPRNVVDPLPSLGTPSASKTGATSGQSAPSGTEDTGSLPAQPAQQQRTRTVRAGGSKRSEWRTMPSGLIAPAKRALVVAGIHGDEQGPRDIVKQLLSDLTSGSSPLAHDFDTIVIPDANPGGFLKKSRVNQMGVDLNRNFPGLRGFPSPPPGTPKQPIQPEVRAIMNVVQTLHPDRILSLHAIEDPHRTKGGAYADPVEGDVARELACRIALRMRGDRDVNVRGNRIDASICNTRYPETSAVSVTTEQSSLGAWASAPKSIGGEATPVITHEVTSVNKPDPLPTTGTGRSVEAIMPGIREFLLDNGQSPSEADSLLHGAVSDAFLTGELVDSPSKNKTLAAITSVVKSRFDDMNAYYKNAWLKPKSAAEKKKLPDSLLPNNEFRSFARQSGIAGDALAKAATFKSSSTDDEIKQAILDVMKTISLPGFSRHAWGTEIDLDPPKRSNWEGSGDKVPLIPFLKSEAFKFGFYHPYSDKRLSSQLPHYEDEPWHLSYWPLATALQQEYMKRITGNVLDNLISRTAKAVHGKIDEKRLKAILATMNLTSFQSNVAPHP